MTDRPSHARARTHESTVEALRPWLEHDALCPAFAEPTHECTCGLAQALADMEARDGSGRDGKETLPPEGPDDITEAQRLIRGLLAYDGGEFEGSHQALVERAQRWVAKADAGQLGEPLYGLAVDLAGDLSDLMEHSDGVYGLHQNGDPAPWGELTRGGRFEDWLSSFDRLRDHLEPGGRCRVCGCTDDNACGAEFGTPCSWTDETRTLCDAPSCVAAAKLQPEEFALALPIAAPDGGLDPNEMEECRAAFEEERRMAGAGECTNTYGCADPSHRGSCGHSPRARPLSWLVDDAGQGSREQSFGADAPMPATLQPCGHYPVEASVRRPVCEGLEEEESRDGLFPGDPGYQDALPASAPRE